MEAATRQAMLNLQAHLHERGFTFADLVDCEVWVTDVSKAGEMDQAYRAFFAGDFPARTIVEVAALPGGSTVEVAAVAAKGARQVIAPRGKPAMAFSSGVLVGDTLYLAHQFGFDYTAGRFVEGDVKAHVAQALRNAGAVLDAAGMTFADVVSTTIFLTDPQQVRPVNEAYRAFTGQPRPALVTVGVTGLPRSAPVGVTLRAKRLRGKAVLPPTENFSRGLLAGRELHIAGVGSAKGTVREQVDDCLGQAKRVVEAAGLTLADVVEARVYLTDINDFAAMNQAYAPHFASGGPPTRATVAVPRLPDGFKMMMGFIAAAPGQ
jgi:2-iminobutanoate/2-iminopropanoate deaminase